MPRITSVGIPGESSRRRDEGQGEQPARTSPWSPPRAMPGRRTASAMAPMSTFQPAVRGCSRAAEHVSFSKANPSWTRSSGVTRTRAPERAVGSASFSIGPPGRPRSSRRDRAIPMVGQAAAFRTSRRTPCPVVTSCRCEIRTPCWVAPRPRRPCGQALIARVSQALGHPVGYITPLLYEIKRSDPRAFRGITVGSNGAYRAGPGWNACTGLGSPDGALLLEALRKRRFRAGVGVNRVRTRVSTS